MAVSTTSGSRLYIGPAVNIDTIKALSDEDAVTYFEGLSYTEVEEIESIGEFGDESGTTTFASLKDERERMFKTVRSAGTLAVVVGRDALDAGQAALIAAEKTDFHYAFKVVFDDSRTGSFSDSVEYFGGLVLGRRTSAGSAADITKRTFNIAVNTTVYNVPTEALSAPANIVLPSIYGASLAQGATLTAVEGSWSNQPTSYSYQWQADTSGNGSFSNIAAATSRTYVIAAGQAGDAIRVQVTATNAAGSSSAADSLPVGLAGS